VVSSVTGHASPGQCLEWGQSVRDWFFGMAWEVANAERRWLPSVNDYLMMRIHTLAGPNWIITLNIANGVDPDPAERARGPVRALVESWCALNGLVNDLASYRKEVRQGDNSSNVIWVIAAERGCGIQEAVLESYRIMDSMATLFLALADQVWARASGPLRTCIRSLECTWRGSIDWSFSAARYNVDGATGRRFQEFPGWAERPTTDEPLAACYPAIGWWWDELV